MVAGNTDVGIRIENSSDHLVRGDLIGLDATGASRLGDSSVEINGFGRNTSNKTIGGSTVAARNVLGGVIPAMAMAGWWMVAQVEVLCRDPRRWMTR